MESLFILVPVALIFVAVALKLFFWAVDNKQFDDLESSGHSILFDEEPRAKPQAPDREQQDPPS